MLAALSSFAQGATELSFSGETDNTGLVIVSVLVTAALAVIAVAAMWRTFVKAGQPGWAALVPIYNIYVMTQIAGRPGWWTLLYFVPLANIVVSLLVSVDTAKRFGKSEVFGIVALWLFNPIGMLILGFGDAKYAPST